jgi:hypothetical protein
MPNNFIQIQPGSQLGTITQGAASDLLTARDRLRQIKAVMEAMIAPGTPSDFSQVEAKFGVIQGQGETLYNLVAGATTQLNGFDITALIDRLGTAR